MHGGWHQFQVKVIIMYVFLNLELIVFKGLDGTGGRKTASKGGGVHSSSGRVVVQIECAYDMLAGTALDGCSSGASVEKVTDDTSADEKHGPE